MPSGCAARLPAKLRWTMSAIVAEAWDQRDVGCRQGKIEGPVVDPRDGPRAQAIGHAAALARLGAAVLQDDGLRDLGLALRRDQPGDAACHRIAGDMALAPPREVEDHILRGEGVAVRPAHAAAQVQPIARGIGIDLPGVEQPRDHVEIGGIAHQRFAEEACGIGLLRPVEESRIVERHHRHADPQRAAVTRTFLGHGRWRQTCEAARRGGSRTERRRERQETPPVEATIADRRGQSRHRRMKGRVGECLRVHHSLRVGMAGRDVMLHDAAAEPDVNRCGHRPWRDND